MTFRDRRLHIEITPATATYRLRSGAPVQIEHFGAPLTVTRDAAATRSIPPAPPPTTVRQPPGRAPRRRIPTGNPP